MSSEDVFQALEFEAANAPAGFVFRRVIPESRFDVQLEVSAPAHQRRLAIGGVRSSRARTAQTRGLITKMAEDEGIFRIELSDVRLAPLFSALSDNFLRVLREARDGADPVVVLMDRLDLWRRLFEEATLEGLSPEQQRGLLCELLFLRDCLATVVGGQLAIEAWTAPHGTAQDFHHGDVAVEVKSRFRKGNTRVRISSEDQLATTASSLYLMVFSLDADQPSGITLPELVEEVRQTLGDALASMAFDDHLIQAGYLDEHASMYEASRYIATPTAFSVVDGFPRFVPHQIPAGVTHVSYDVDLAACAPFAIGVEQVKEVLRNANGETR